MAQDIVASVAGLKNSVDSLSARIRATGERSMARLRESREMARIDSLIKISSEIDASYSKIRKTKDLLRASGEMRRDPDRWSSPGEYLRWEEATGRRNKKEFLREQRISDTVREILSPEVQHKYDLEREYGRSGADRILAAEDRSRRDKGRKAYEWDILSDSEKKLHALTEKYGGGEIGDQMARDAIQRTQRENVRVAMMDDYSRFIYENTDRYGKAGAEMVFRQKLMKELPPFLKNTNLSTKTLINIDKTIKALKGIPLIGQLMHPGALGLAALGIANSVLSSSDAANKTVTAWSASKALSGSPSKRFDAMARIAGAKDEQEVLKMYGSLLEKFGTEDAFEMMGHALRSAAPGIQRLSVAKSLGIDEKQANALMYLAGEAPLESTSEAQSTAVKYSRLEDVEKWGLRSGSSFIQKARSAALWLPLEKSLEARGTSWGELINPLGSFIMRKVFGSQTDNIDEAMRRNMESMNAAESLDEAERQGDTTMNSNVRNSAIYITNMNVQTNDPKTFSEALDGMANGDNRGLLATSGNYVLA